MNDARPTYVTINKFISEVEVYIFFFFMPPTQVLKPVCEELRKRGASGGGPSGEGGGSAGGEEDTFVSLRTSRRTLDLKFPTVPTRCVAPRNLVVGGVLLVVECRRRQKALQLQRRKLCRNVCDVPCNDVLFVDPAE